MSTMELLGDSLWLQQHPLSLMGMQMGKAVTVIRLASGKLLIHSTAPFSDDDVAAITELGSPGWIMDPTNLHDTCAVAGTRAFPEIPYLVPAGFPVAKKTNATLLDAAPAEWENEIEVLPIAGMPKINEHAIYHRASKTLIVADLLFNLPADADGWTRGALRLISGIDQYPGNSRMFRLMIKDKKAFADSLRKILDLDFEQVVVGHGVPVIGNAKDKVSQIFRDLDFAI